MTAWSSQTLSRNPFQSSITPGRFSILLPVSTQSWCKSLLISQYWHLLASSAGSSIVCEMESDCTVAVLLNVATRISLKLYVCVVLIKLFLCMVCCAHVVLDFYIIDNLSIVVHTFSRCMLTSLTVDEILLPRYVNFSINLNMGMALSCLKSIFYLHSCRAQCFLLLAPGYAIRILFGLVYLQETLDCLHSLLLS